MSSERMFLIVCLLIHLHLPSTQGLNPNGYNSTTEIFARSGSDVLLSPGYNLTIDMENRTRCDQFIWNYNGFSGSQRISRGKQCKLTEYNFTRISTYKTSLGGHLTLINVTARHSGNYTVIVNNQTGGLLHLQYYTLQVQAPVSAPLLNVSCRHDGGANILCRTDTGDDPRFSIMVNGHLLPEKSTSSRTVEGASEVTVPVTLQRPWDVTCSVRNHVSDNQTRKTKVTCPVPLSDPDLEVSCLHNGHLQISCSVKNGSDPIFSLSVNGKLLLANEKGRVNISSPSLGPWDIRCSVKNVLGEKNHSKTYAACPVQPSVPVLKVSCHNGSLQISCSVDSGTSPIFYLSVNGETFTENVTKGQKMINVTSVMSPGPWQVHCSVRNNLGEKNSSETYETCPDIQSVRSISWGHLIFHGLVCVLYTLLLLCIVRDLRKMKTHS